MLRPSRRDRNLRARQVGGIRMGKLRKGAVLLTLTMMFAALTALLAGAASAQTVACPAGARGGAGGDAGRATGGNGGLAFTVGGFGTTGNASAAGGNSGS